jgi:hypothetical protein
MCQHVRWLLLRPEPGPRQPVLRLLLSLLQLLDLLLERLLLLLRRGSERLRPADAARHLRGRALLDVLRRWCRGRRRDGGRLRRPSGTGQAEALHCLLEPRGRRLDVAS